jgi:hypothetical protein
MKGGPVLAGTILSTLLLVSCGGGSGSISMEDYGGVENPAAASFRCSGFAGVCTLYWGPQGPHEGISYGLSRADLGSAEYVDVNARPILASVKHGAEPNNPVFHLVAHGGDTAFDGHLSGSLEPGEPFAYVDAGLEVGVATARVYKYKLEAALPDGDTQVFGPVICSPGYPAAPPTNTFLGAVRRPSGGAVELAIISDRSLTITGSVNRVGDDRHDAVFERELDPGYHVLRWDIRLKPGEYEIHIPMVGWDEREFDAVQRFTVE